MISHEEALETIAALRRANTLAVAALTHLREGALARRDEYAMTEIDYVLRDMHAEQGNGE